MYASPLLRRMAMLVAFGVGACRDEAPTATALHSTTARLDHVGYSGPDHALGFVTNDAECHIGKKGARWPVAEQYDVKTFDAHVGITPGGIVTLVCHGRIPSGQPLPEQAEVEQDVLCFLPGQRQTRDAQEVFTPSGEIHLTCHLNPNRP